MHKGKQYPFAPRFWVPTTFFWPSFCPWKYIINYGFWYGLGEIVGPDTPSPWVSGPVENTGTDAQKWSWPVTWSIAFDLVTLEVYCTTHLGQKVTVFHLQIWLAGVEVTGGYATFGAELYALHYIGETFYLAPFNTGPIVGSLDWVVATYAQGGSPWPQ